MSEDKIARLAARWQDEARALRNAAARIGSTSGDMVTMNTAANVLERCAAEALVASEKEPENG